MKKERREKVKGRSGKKTRTEEKGEVGGQGLERREEFEEEREKRIRGKR